MIAAGIGSRRGVSAAEVVKAVEAALAEHGLARGELGLLATVKPDEAGILAAGERLGLPVRVVAGEADTPTRSQASLAATGLGSASEAAALAAAGPGAALLGPRTVLGAVTCALARSGGAA